MILLTIMSEVINMFVLGITGPTSLVVISIIALIIFGPTKLPQFGRAIGSTLKEFKSAAENGVFLCLYLVITYYNIVKYYF